MSRYDDHDEIEHDLYRAAIVAGFAYAYAKANPKGKWHYRCGVAFWGFVVFAIQIGDCIVHGHAFDTSTLNIVLNAVLGFIVFLLILPPTQKEIDDWNATH